jgi:hypothetical protein
MFKFYSNLQSSAAPKIKTCGRNSPQLADCVKNAIEYLRNDITNGFAGVFSGNAITEGLNPLTIGDINAQRNFNMQLKNLKVFGLGNFKVDKLRINVENFKVIFFH